MLALLRAALATLNAGGRMAPVAGFAGLMLVVVYPTMGLIAGFLGGVLTAFANNVAAAVIRGPEMEL